MVTVRRYIPLRHGCRNGLLGDAPNPCGADQKVVLATMTSLMKVVSPEIWKATKSHASGPPAPDEYMDVRTARPDVEYKFQGQEAPIVIFSMTTSTHADAPRGMNFLYSLNRLNVATSRAKALSILVGSPALFEPECRTPAQMRMANAFCRYLEMASRL
jgi:hypothetical protein